MPELVTKQCELMQRNHRFDMADFNRLTSGCLTRDCPAPFATVDRLATQHGGHRSDAPEQTRRVRRLVGRAGDRVTVRIAIEVLMTGQSPVGEVGRLKIGVHAS